MISMSKVLGGQILLFFFSADSLVGSGFLMRLVVFDCELPVDDFNWRHPEGLRWSIHSSREDLWVSKLHRDSYWWGEKKSNNLIKKWTEDMHKQFTEKKYKQPIMEKMNNFTCNQGNTIREIILHASDWQK